MQENHVEEVIDMNESQALNVVDCAVSAAVIVAVAVFFLKVVTYAPAAL